MATIAVLGLTSRARFIAGHLAFSGHHLTLAITPEHDDLPRRGLAIEHTADDSVEHSHTHPTLHIRPSQLTCLPRDVPPAQMVDWLLIDEPPSRLASEAAALKPWFERARRIVCLSTFLPAMERLVELAPEREVFQVLTTLRASVAPIGTVIHHGGGSMAVGHHRLDSIEQNQLCDLVRSAGFHVRKPQRLLAERWQIEMLQAVLRLPEAEPQRIRSGEAKVRLMERLEAIRALANDDLLRRWLPDRIDHAASERIHDCLLYTSDAADDM
jgi:ketopantoate reductase